MSKNKQNTTTTEKVENKVEEVKVEEVKVEEVKVIEPEKLKVDSETDKLYGGVSLAVQSHLATIEAYVKAMSPGVIVTDSNGVMWQDRLHNAMVSIINMKDVGDMVDGLDGIIALFARESKGALNVSYTQRFTYKWAVDESKRNLYSDLCYIFYTFANPEQRKKMGKYIDLTSESSTLQAIPSTTRQRLNNYLRRLSND